MTTPSKWLFLRFPRRRDDFVAFLPVVQCSAKRKSAVKNRSLKKITRVNNNRIKWRRCGESSPLPRLRLPRERVGKKCRSRRQGRQVQRVVSDSESRRMWPPFRRDVACLRMTHRCTRWLASRGGGEGAGRVVPRGMGKRSALLVLGN